MNLIKSGINTFIYDTDDNEKENVKDKNVTWLPLHQRLPKNEDIVVICLHSPEAVAYVVVPRNGLLEGLSPQ